jgi:hypothetical protein
MRHLQKSEVRSQTRPSYLDDEAEAGGRLLKDRELQRFNKAYVSP